MLSPLFCSLGLCIIVGYREASDHHDHVQFGDPGRHAILVHHHLFFVSLACRGSAFLYSMKDPGSRLDLGLGLEKNIMLEARNDDRLDCIKNRVIKMFWDFSRAQF